MVYNNLTTGYNYLDGYNSTIYDNYYLQEVPIKSNNTILSNKNAVDINKNAVDINKSAVDINKNAVDINISDKLLDVNKNYIKIILLSLEENIYNMQQNIFDLEGKDDLQTEINTYHLEMLIYTQFLFKKLEKNISNPTEFNILLINILSKINEQIQS